MYIKRVKSMFGKKALSLLLAVALLIGAGSMTGKVKTANAAGATRYTVLVLDTSGSSGFTSNGSTIYTADTAINYVKASAKKFIADVVKADGTNYVALVSFKSKAQVVSPFSTDLNGLNAAIDGLYASENTRSIAAGLQAADTLISGINDQAATKNVVLFTTGMTNDGNSSESGHYDSNTVGSSWYRSDTGINLYKYANVAYDVAATLKEKATLYSVGLFQTMSGMPEAGRPIAEFFRQFASDLATSADTFYDVDDPNNLEFMFGKVADDITQPDDNENCPIIVIPGIMGSNLYVRPDQFDIATQEWPPLSLQIFGLGNSINIDKTLFTKPIENQNASGVKREYGSLNTYKELVDSLCKRFPYRAVYFFSYDFRQSNSETADLLNWQISKILSDYPQYSKVDIVCHSMGGLVASSYVSRHGTSELRKVVTLATPYEGAPTLLNTTLNGDAMGFASAVVGISKEVKAGFPSLAQLAPSESYFNRYEFYRYSYTKSSGFLGLNKKRMYDTIDYSQYKTICKEIFGSNYDKAQAFYNSINPSDSWGLNALTDFDNSYFAVGIDQPTVGSLFFNDGNSLNSLACEDLAYDMHGDGTVPYDSSTMIDQLKTIKNANVRVREFGTTHGGMVNHGALVGFKDKKDTDKAIQWAGDILSGSTSSIQSDSKENKQYIVIRIACPVDVSIETQDGILSSAPKGISTLAPFGRLDFLGADNDIKMLCLEDWDNYSVKLNGTGTGTMDYTVRWFNADDTLADERTFNDVPITKDTVIQTNTDKNADTVLSIDVNGDSIIDETWKSDPNSFGAKVSEITVTFDSAGGTAVPAAKVISGNPAAEPKAPKRKGYKFTGWYAAGAKTAWDFRTPVTASMTLTAHWTSTGSGGSSGGKIHTKLSSLPFTGDMSSIWQMGVILLLAVSVGFTVIFSRRNWRYRA